MRQFHPAGIAALIATCGFGGIFTPLPSNADTQSLPIALSPTRIEFAAYPGDALTGTLEFWNGTDGSLAVNVMAEDFTPQDEEGHVAVTAPAIPNTPPQSSPPGGEENHSLAGWIAPEYPSLTVFPGQDIPLGFTVRIPPAAEPGSYWGAVLVKALPAETGAGSAIEASVGAIVLLRVYGEAKQSLAVESVDAPKFSEASPITLAVRFRNNGTVHLKPSGVISVRNIFGREVSRVALPEKNVLPGFVRKVQADVGEGLRGGRYTATLEARYGAANQALHAEMAFWVFPWKTYGPAALIWTGLAGFVIAKRRNFRAAFQALRENEPAPGA